MSEYMTLLGAEEVGRAAVTMREAARDFASAVAALGEEYRRHEQAMREIIAEMNPRHEEERG